MKYTFLKTLRERCEKVMVSEYDLSAFLSDTIEIAKNVIDGPQEEPGTTTPEQNIDNFLMDQDIFDRNLFTKDTLCINTDKFIENTKKELVAFAADQGIKPEDAAFKYIKSKQTFLKPNAFEVIVYHLLKFI